MKKTFSKKRIIELGIGAIITLIIIIMAILYNNNYNFKNYMDKYIFMKEKHENNLPQISITSSNEINTYAYKNNIFVLKNNLLTVYNANGTEDYSLEIDVSNPIFESAGNYLCIGEKNGNKLYVISSKNIVWQKDVEGAITDITINQDGCVAVAMTGTLYKTIVQTFNNKGEGLFKRFFSSTYVIDMTIAPDSKNLAIAEANFSGIMIQSNIKIISIEKAQNEEQDATIYTQTNKEGDLIVNIKYQNKDELACVYDDHIEVIKNGVSSNVSDFAQEDILFVDLNNKIVKIIKRSSKVYLQLINNTQTERIKEYEIDEPKSVWVSDQVIAINLGSEVLFYNNSGWLIKKYYASQEINQIVLSNNLAGVVYNNKIELVSL